LRDNPWLFSEGDKSYPTNSGLSITGWLPAHQPHIYNTIINVAIINISQNQKVLLIFISSFYLVLPQSQEEILPLDNCIYKKDSVCDHHYLQCK
jgi:hypothetical protein